MSLRRESLPKLLAGLSPDSIVALTVQGTPKPMETVATDLAKVQTPVLLVGGFPIGHFSKRTIDLASERYRIDHRRLEAWTVVGRAVYDYERAIGLKRF